MCLCMVHVSHVMSMILFGLDENDGNKYWWSKRVVQSEKRTAKAKWGGKVNGRVATICDEPSILMTPFLLSMGE